MLPKSNQTRAMGSEQSSLTGIKSNEVNFTINGIEHSIRTDGTSSGIGPNTVLLDYIRDKAALKGTKFLCREGGCGACVVSVKSRDPATGSETVRAVNACLTPVFSCDGWKIETVEALGSHKTGYHQIQNRLVAAGGTQCGFCTPGMVMNMYALQNGSKKDLTMRDIEDAFDGNICRCTGYRPIMDAFKTFAKDATPELSKMAREDKTPSRCANCSCSSKCGGDAPKIQDPPQMLHLKVGSGEEWIRPDSLDSLFEVIQRLRTAQLQFRYVAGNTGMGVYRDVGPSSNYIDFNSIPELKVNIVSKEKLTLGGGTTLANAIEALGRAAEFDEYKGYAGRVASHIKRIANTPVRNAGTLAGNLMLKHKHPYFPSDIFTILEGLGARLVIASAPNLNQEVSPSEFLGLDMGGRIILAINFPQLKEADSWVFRSFKISKRYQNAHAYVNAAFLIKVDAGKNFEVQGQPRIVYGGIMPKFAHAEATESFLQGKSLKDQFTIKGATDALEKEINPDHVLPDAEPEYRKNLAMALFYKTVLSIMGTVASEKVRSGGGEIERKVTSGKRDFDTDKADWPINQPVHKLESNAQASGEAEYTNDIHPQQGELFGMLIQTTVANADLASVDASEALQVPGVVAFVSAKDIPGVNNYQTNIMFPNDMEEVFVSKKVNHAGASVGLLMGVNREVVQSATRKVKVTYTNIQKPVVDIVQSMAKSGIKMEPNLANISDAPHRIQGQLKIGKQFHFSMEPQTSIVIPKEDGTFDVYAATQWMTHVQTAIANVLNIPQHNINIWVKRLGGGYGAKITRASQVTAAAAVGAHVTGKAVRVVLDLEHNMNLVGTRQPYVMSYDVGFDDTGKIIDNQIKLTCDPGFIGNEFTSQYATMFIQSCYNVQGWNVEFDKTLTNTHANTWCRAPGSTESIALVEHIMEHIGRSLKKDPGEVRSVNYVKEGDPAYYVTPEEKFHGENLVPKMTEQLKQSSEFDKRTAEVKQFNEVNRWKKRGMALVPIRYALHYGLVNFPVYVTVYHGDGTVAVTSGGIEMGQGLNTKLAQAVASKLAIPLEKVRVKASNNLTGPNCHPTGGAMTSELVAGGALKACEILNKRMEPIRTKLGSSDWEKVVAEAYKEGIELSASYLLSKVDGLKEYDIYGVILMEVEIDVLTGENKIARVDLIEDTGKSINPEIDIGQIEGALIMGIGYWTTEKMIYDPETGELLTNNTWNYKPPLPKDIPEDLRVTLLKNAPNPFGILRSKATGEPPLCLGIAVLLAMRNAIDSARLDAGVSDTWYQMDAPVGPEDIVRLCMTSKTQFVL